MTSFIRDLITGSTDQTIWPYHVSGGDISGFMGKPYLDVLSLYTYTDNNKLNTNFYLIPGAADFSVCNVLANQIGCGPCVDMSYAIANSSYDIQLGLLYENPETLGNSFTNKTSADIESGGVKAAGWGLTYCAKNPEDYTSSDPIKVKVSQVDINPRKDTYGYSSDAVDNRYAYWLEGFSET